jgi:hypothetical protein
MRDSLAGFATIAVVIGPYMSQKRSRLGAKELVGLIGLITSIAACIAAVIVVPEVRRALGLDGITTETPPRFTVSAINTLANNKIYETTDHFIGIDPTKGIEDVTLTWGLEVIPNYNGSTQYGEVRVLVKNARGDILAEGKWDNFNRASTTLAVALNPYRLSNEVESMNLRGGFRENIFETGNFKPPETILDIEIVQASNLSSPLLKDKLIIRNSPWYHYTTLSAWHGNSIDVYIYGKNLGDASEFAVVGDIFEVTQVPGYIWNPWPRLDTQKKVIAVDSGDDFVVTLTFPGDSYFEFEKGKTYLAHTYVLKKQNYVRFSDGTWDSSNNNWRLGSFGNQLLIQP